MVLVCEIIREGKPARPLTQKATWYRDGELLTLTEDVDGKYVMNDRNRALEIKVNDLTKEDSGLYTCNIENEVRHGDKEPFEARVQCKGVEHFTFFRLFCVF